MADTKEEEVHPDDDPDPAELLDRAEKEREAGRAAAAVPLLETALEATIEVLGEKHLHVATIMLAQCRVYRSMDRLDEVNTLCGNARDIISAQLDGKELPETRTAMLYGTMSRIMHMQARAMVMNGEKTLAIEEVLSMVIDLTELLDGTVHDDILMYQVHLEVALENVNFHFNSAGRNPLVEPLYRLAEAYSEAGRDKYPEHPDPCSTAAMLLSHYTMMEQIDILEPIFDKALQFCVDALGDRHPIVADRCSDLACLYRAQEDYETSLWWQKKALDIKREESTCLHGAPTIGLAKVINYLAEIHQELGHFHDSEKMFVEALSIALPATKEAEKSNENNEYFGNLNMLTTALIMHNLALLYREQGRVKLRPLPRRAPTHPPVEIVDYLEKAVPLFKKSLAVREAVLGPDDELVSESLADLAVCYQLQANTEDATPLAQRSDKINFEQGTIKELRLLRELMTEGQGVVQQELDHHRAFLDQFSVNLASNKREKIRHTERLSRLHRKYKEEVALQKETEAKCQRRIDACNNQHRVTMRQKMKWESEIKVLDREYGVVVAEHKAQRVDRIKLVRKREELIRENIESKAHIKQQVEVSAKEVCRLEQLLASRYRKVIQKAFRVFDSDKSGSIDPSECREVLDILEPDMSLDRKMALIVNADKDGDGEIDFEEFVGLLLRRDTNFEKLKEAFNAADVDGSGSIDAEELRAVLAMVEPTMTEEEIRQAIRAADKDDDGTVDYKEFIKFMLHRAGVEDANEGQGAGAAFMPSVKYGKKHDAAALRIQSAQRQKKARRRIAEQKRLKGAIMHKGM